MDVGQIYVVAFNEVYEHLHVLLATRPPGTAEAIRGPDLLLRYDHLREPATAAIVAERLTEHLQTHSSTTR
jgi:hypothetical protein